MANFEITQRTVFQTTGLDAWGVGRSALPTQFGNDEAQYIAYLKQYMTLLQNVGYVPPGCEGAEGELIHLNSYAGPNTPIITPSTPAAIADYYLLRQGFTNSLNSLAFNYGGAFARNDPYDSEQPDERPLSAKIGIVSETDTNTILWGMSVEGNAVNGVCTISSQSPIGGPFNLLPGVIYYFSGFADAQTRTIGGTTYSFGLYQEANWQLPIVNKFLLPQALTAIYPECGVIPPAPPAPNSFAFYRPGDDGVPEDAGGLILNDRQHKIMANYLMPIGTIKKG